MKETFTKFRITNNKRNETMHISTTSGEQALHILNWPREDCTIEELGTEEVEAGGTNK